MTLTGHPCGACEADAGPGRYVCRPCTDRVRRLLGSVPDLLGELEVTLTKDHRFRPQGERVTGSADDTAVPFHVGASNARTTLRGVLVTWARHVVDALGRTFDARRTEDVAALLAETLDWSVSHPAGVDLVNQVEREITRAWHVVDRPTDRHYLGTCDVNGCTGAVYQHGTNADARCSVCRTAVPAADRRADMLDTAADLTFNAAEVEQMTASLGQRVSAGKVRTWASRGRLAPAVVVGSPRYRLADVLALAGGAA